MNTRYSKLLLAFLSFALVGCDTQNPTTKVASAPDIANNPGLTKCRVCSGMVAVEAQACPHCGAPNPSGKANIPPSPAAVATSPTPEPVTDEPPKITYYENGQKKEEKHYKNDQLDGLWTRWDENGNKTVEIQYKDGKQDGLKTKWYENGKKGSESHWKNGKLVSASAWKPDGEPCTATKIVDGSGNIVGWHENGQKWIEYHYRNGKLWGQTGGWHDNGQKKRQGQFKDGKKVVDNDMRMIDCAKSPNRFLGNPKYGAVYEYIYELCRGRKSKDEICDTFFLFEYGIARSGFSSKTTLNMLQKAKQWTRGGDVDRIVRTMESAFAYAVVVKKDPVGLEWAGMTAEELTLQHMRLLIGGGPQER